MVQHSPAKCDIVAPTVPPAAIDSAAARLRELSDFDLVGLVRAGRLEAFEILMRRYNRRLFRLSKSIVRNDCDAEDVVQEAYLRAFTRLDSFRGPAGFGAWLSRIAHNEALQMIRRAKKQVSLDEPLISSEGDQMFRHDFLVTNQPGPERLAESGELRRKLEMTIDALPDNFRAVFMLRAVEGLSVAETAECLSIRHETVKTRYHRARCLMKEALSGTHEEVLATVYQFAGARCDRIVAAVLTAIRAREPSPTDNREDLHPGTFSPENHH